MVQINFVSAENNIILLTCLELSYEPAAGDKGGCIPSGQDIEICNVETCVKCKSMWNVKADKNLCEVW